MSLPGLPEHAERLKQQFQALYDQAIAEAQSPGAALQRQDLRGWAPSVVMKSQRKQDHLRALFVQAWPVAIRKRLGQLRVINRKLVRCCPDWSPWDDDRLLQPPPTNGRSLKILQSHYEQ